MIRLPTVSYLLSVVADKENLFKLMKFGFGGNNDQLELNTSIANEQGQQDRLKIDP